MSRKTSWLILILILAALALAACGGKEEPTSTPEPAETAEETAEETTAEEPEEAAGPCAPATEGPLAWVDSRGQEVVWWHNYGTSRQEELYPLIDEWNATNECGITVIPEHQGNYDRIRDKMNAAIATGELPGLVVGNQDDQAFYALAGGLADLNLYVDDAYWGLGEEKAQFYPGILEQGVHPTFGNQRLGFPPNRSMEMLFYNQTWLEELGYEGPPTTPEEFKEMACAAAEDKGDGTGGYILRDDASAVAAWTMAFGGSVLSRDGTGYAYNGRATVAAMTFLKEMLDEGCAYFFTEGYPDPEFAARRAIFTQGSSSGLPYYESGTATAAEEEGREPDEWGVTAIPHTTADPVQDIYGGDVMIPATTPETQLAAWIFVKWFTSAEIQAEWTRISNYFPTRADAAEYLSDYLDENPQWATALGLLPYGTYEPPLISYESVRDAAQGAFDEIMQGADVQATLYALTEEANALQEELMAGIELVIEEPGEPAGPCAPATEGPLAWVDSRGQEVVWWHNYGTSRQEELYPLIDEWNAINECGITVIPEHQGNYDRIRDKMNVAIATGELPGLVVGNQDDQAFYALAGGLADLNLYVDDAYWGLGEEKAQFYPGILEQGVHPTFGNQRLGFPPNRSMEMLFYNQTWLEELGYEGPPTTPDEMKEMACAAAEANGDGTGGYILRDDAPAMAAWTMAFGGSVLSRDGTGYAYNGRATVAAMTFLQGMVDEGCAYLFAEGYPNPEFAARRAIFTTDSSFAIPDYEDDVNAVAEEAGREPDEWDVTAIPHTTADPVQDIYGGDVMIPATTPETQLAAWIFVKWFTSAEIQAEWTRISNYFPTRADAAEYLTDYLDENPQWATALSLLPYGTYEPQLISYQSVRDAAQAAFNEIMQGADVQATLDALTDEANALQEELMGELE